MCRRISCIARRWRLGLCGMPSAIGKVGKIFNHEIDEIHENGMGVRGWRGWSVWTACLMVREKSTVSSGRAFRERGST